MFFPVTFTRDRTVNWGDGSITRCWSLVFAWRRFTFEYTSPIRRF